MKHGSLFSGIGGFDLAAELMGWENVFHCEWNPFGQKVFETLLATINFIQ
jgi:DNA (cytosine-5)-methyltransferase 1